ncbi:MAG: hypothetical protein U5K71_12070 [Gracilimonas sp.]|nr:hypothetical protein [Gracilimonas sp.]
MLRVISEETGRVVRFRGNIGQAFHVRHLKALVEVSDMPSIIGKGHPGIFKFSIYFANTALTQVAVSWTQTFPVWMDNNVEFVPLVNMKTGINFGFNRSDWEVFTIHATVPESVYRCLQCRAKCPFDNQSGIRGEIPAYDVLDLSFSYTWENFTLESGINNVLDNWYFTRRATGLSRTRNHSIPTADTLDYMTL